MTSISVEVNNYPRITLRDVTHRFNANTAPILSMVNLTIDADGTSTAIVAPSGSGKTTLLGILGQIMVPTSGVVDVDGVMKQKACAWVLQTTNVLLRRTAIDNVAMSALSSGFHKADADKVASESLRSVGLSDRAYYPARLLSGGEVQRVAVARALASGAPFLLADEPTGQLDKSTSDLVSSVLLDAVKERVMGLVLVTHDIELAQRCTRRFTLVNSRLEQIA